MTDDTKTPKELRFDYIKSNHFRVVHADGVFGGVTNKGLIWATFWSERGAIPTQSVYKVTPEGKLDEDLTKRVVRDAIIREAEVSLMLDLGLARSLRGWLDEKITAIEAVHEKRSSPAPATEERKL